MRCFRLAMEIAGQRWSRISTGLAILVAAAWDPVLRGLWQSHLGSWIAEGAAPQALTVGCFAGLYLGLLWTSDGLFLESRMHSGEALGLRACILMLTVGGVGAIDLISDIWGPTAEILNFATWLGWAWSVALLCLVALALLPWCAGGGRCFLAVVALVWWIPSILPPSFLVAVPRALRNEAEGFGGIAVPSTPSAWLADTALAAGLLLLAWAPRRATFRGDEVRHPG